MHSSPQHFLLRQDLAEATYAKEASDALGALDAFESALSGALRPADEERARAGQARCMARVGHLGEARQAAREYLERWPTGRHEAEMRALVDGR